MPSLGALFKSAAGMATQPSSGSHVTDAPEMPRREIGLATEHLEREMLDLYWAGVRRELPHILLTLRRWQSQEEYANTVLADEADTHIHGYDTFLDQVSHSSRQFTERNDVAVTAQEQSSGESLPTYTEALQNRGWDMFNEIQSQEIRESIRTTLDEEDASPDILRRRARMLLQSSQFLDIDKIIEYREPEKLVSFWKRPAPPQVVTRTVDEEQMPVFEARTCVECDSIIRSSTFFHVQDETLSICESCYRARHYGQTKFTKRYKESCLHRDLSAETTRKLCFCTAVPRRDEDGNLRPLWPIGNEKKEDKHLNGGSGKVRCRLYELPDMVAEAKYAGTRMKVDKNTTLDSELKRAVRDAKRMDFDAGRSSKNKRPTRTGLTRFVNTAQSSVAEYGKSYGYTEKSPENIPIYLRSITDKYPYGNVHMALRFGPIIIENGVANTHGGVLITSRDPPHLQVLRDSEEEIEYSLLLAGKSERRLYGQSRPRAPKRYKAMMKQVVGGAFCGFFAEHLEDELIDAALAESRNLIEEGISASEKATLLRHATTRLLVKVKAYLGPRVEAYIASIATRLVSPVVDLHWTFYSNNCQAFCDSLIDRNLFGSLFAVDQPVDYATDRPLPSSLYLMSFVCRPGAYIKAKTKSKFDVPNGLTEEYLLKFRYGRHEESDIIDTLSEYWYDWGAFESGIYPYQDVFPWDCTEAYGRYPIKCSECNISKHVWAFPFDSWSLISLHLSRGRQLYPREAFAPGSALNRNPAQANDGRVPNGLMSDLEWFQNRLNILLGQDTLLKTAVAMARCTPFRQATLWLSNQEDESKDRLKLGGIHRAQPFSHHFEKGAFHQYFVAEWSHLTRAQRIKAYEELRDWKATRKDVGSTSSDNDGGGGGCGGFLCGVYAVGCAAGCSATGEDSCGSNCVTTSSGDGGDGGDGGCGGCGGCGG